MFKKRNAQGLSITVAVIAVLAIIVLVVLIALFTGQTGVGGLSAASREAASCLNVCKALGKDEGTTVGSDTAPSCYPGHEKVVGKYEGRLGGMCCCKPKDTTTTTT